VFAPRKAMSSVRKQETMTMTTTRTLVLVGLCLAAAPARAQHAGHAHGAHAGHSAAPSRTADIAARGRQVMRFDLDRSVHVFRRTPDGGTQSVISKDGAADQVRLIRAHLKTEAAAFALDDYSSPALVHGKTMPGLRELASARGQVRAHYEPIRNGARIRFVAREPALVRALHRWFGAQVTDHGAHAMHAKTP
jgi:hypothetical protein